MFWQSYVHFVYNFLYLSFFFFFFFFFFYIFRQSFKVRYSVRICSRTTFAATCWNLMSICILLHDCLEVYVILECQSISCLPNKPSCQDHQLLDYLRQKVEIFMSTPNFRVLMITYINNKPIVL